MSYLDVAVARSTSNKIKSRTKRTGKSPAKSPAKSPTKNPGKSTTKSENYLCYDLGGTKLMAALINSSGRILASETRHVDQSQGVQGLIHDFEQLATSLPKVRYMSISVASAVPLHAEKGVLLDPTNFFSDGKSWGVVPIVALLKRKLKRSVLLENDAAAAVLAEKWKGGHGRAQNIVAMTLGTGVGIGVVVNGELLRSGRGLHPEASHISISGEDADFACGCGANGCIEANLGGTHFARRLSKKLGREVDGVECLRLAIAGDPVTLEAFRDYGKRLAVAIRAMAILFAPEIVVLSGGFSQASPYFLPETEKSLPHLLRRYREGIDLLPKVCVSKLEGKQGVLGAAYVANHSKRKV